MANYNTNVPFTGDGHTSSHSSWATVGMDVLQVGHVTYDFALDGGAISTLVPVTNFQLPLGAIITGGIIKVATTFVGANATIAVGAQSSQGGTTTSFLGATPVASFTANTIFVISGASPLNITTGPNGKTNSITVTIATAALTAGRMEIFLEFVVSPV